MNVFGNTRTVESYLYLSDRERIVSMLLEMGFKAGHALKDAVDALFAEDCGLAEKTVKDDDEIDAMERDIDQECLRSIAMRQPVREELRFVFAVLKTITDLERIGDQAVNIARWAVDLKKYPPMTINPAIIEMRDVAGEMLRDALSAFKAADADMSVGICLRDAELDRMYAAVFDEFVELMAACDRGDTAAVRVATGQMWIARHLERVGDHVTNIAERVYFMSKGSALRHERPE